MSKSYLSMWSYRDYVLLVLLALWFLYPPTAIATTEETMQDLIHLPLEELLNVDVQATSKTQKKPLRETPGIVTIITEEEIANSGARDLIDVLRLVPGFDFGVDLYNVVGVGIRGTWAHEGKVLLLIDGIEMNERRYSNTVFGDHYPIDQIQRIEIIRGPGSVNYGGFAELGVVNIITKTADAIDGVDLVGLYGRRSHSSGRSMFNMMYGKKWDDLEITTSGFFGKSHRSDERYIDFDGNSFEMKNSSALNPHFVNLSLSYRGFSHRLIVDNYRTTSRDFFGPVSDSLWKVDFKSWDYLTTYSHEFNKQLTLHVKASYSHQNAWRQDNGDETQRFAMFTNRFLTNAHVNYTVNDKLDIAIGAEFLADRAIDDTLVNPRVLPSFSNHTIFTEAAYKTCLGNVTVGARFDYHNVFGSHLAPRIGLTKVLGKLHYKLLYSNSFRTPVVENVYLNPNIKPETTNVFEVEVGYQFNKDMAIVANIFDIQSQDTIVYDVIPPTGTDSYFNAAKTGSRGIEAEFRFKQTWGYLTLNYSHYQAAHGMPNNFRAWDFQTNTINPDVHLGFPAHKVTLNSHIKLTSNVFFNPSLSMYSSRYGYETADVDGNPVLKKYSPYTLANLFFRYQPEAIKYFEIGFGVYDLFAENPPFLQPYDGGHAPLPGPSREWLLKLSYKW